MTVSKKEQISQGALRVFAQYGFNDTKMDTIAEEAKVAKGTLYYHFKTKEDLFIYVNEEGVKMLIDSVTKVIRDSSLSISERIYYVFDEHLRFFSENQELCQLLLNISGDWQRNHLIGKVLYHYFEVMEELISNLQQAGIISRSLEVRTVASGLFGMIGMTVLRRMIRGETVNTPETRSTLLALCQGAIGMEIIH